MYIRYWLPEVNLFIKLHAASADEPHWKKDEKEREKGKLYDDGILFIFLNQAIFSKKETT